MTWQIVNDVKQANGGALPPSGRPENRLFVPADLRPQVAGPTPRCSPVIRAFAFSLSFWWPSIKLEVHGAPGLPGQHPSPYFYGQILKMTRFFALPKLPSAKEWSKNNDQPYLQVTWVPQRHCVAPVCVMILGGVLQTHWSNGYLTSGYHPECSG